MKCIRFIGSTQVFRTSDAKAEKLVKAKEAVYTDKGMWKKTGRKYIG